MADTKITALAALAGANIAAGDKFVLVDISDTSMNASGTDKNMTADELAQGLALDGRLTFNDVTADPAAPSAGLMRAYADGYGGRMSLKTLGPTGRPTPLQEAMWDGSLYWWTQTTATAGLWIGTVGAGAGTFANTLPTSTNQYTMGKRARYSNVVTTTNQVLGQRGTEALFELGNAAGLGGFFFHARCGFDTWTNGSRFFAGMHTGTTVISADPSALNNTVGFCVDAADNGAISFLMRGTTATKTSTGLTIVTNKGYDVCFWAPPNSTTVGYRIVDVNAGTIASGSVSANAPAVNTFLTPGVLASNAALTPVNSTQLGVDHIYVYTEN
jgi:hypothetical protein